MCGGRPTVRGHENENDPRAAGEAVRYTKNPCSVGLNSARSAERGLSDDVNGGRKTHVDKNNRVLFLFWFFISLIKDAAYFPGCFL